MMLMLKINTITKNIFFIIQGVYAHIAKFIWDILHDI